MVVLFGCVDRTFFRVWSMCPLIVAANFGKCLRTAAVVRPGQDWKNPFCMAEIHVERTGLKAAAWRYFTRAGMLFVLYALLHWLGMVQVYWGGSDGVVGFV